MFNKILFDLDGTLTDPKEGITKSVQHALRHFGIEEDTENLTKFIGPPLIDSFMNYYGFTREQAFTATDVYRERFAPIGKFENEVYDGIPQMLQELKSKGIILAIASSKPELFVEQILEHFDLLKYFDVVVGSLLNETRTKKEEVLEEALKRLEVNGPDDTVAMVGDRKFDILGAKTFGLTAIGVRFGYAEEGELEEAQADYIADTVNDLKQYLLG